MDGRAVTEGRESLLPLGPTPVSERYEVWFWHAERGATWRQWDSYANRESAQAAASHRREDWPGAKTSIVRAVLTREVVDD